MNTGELYLLGKHLMELAQEGMRDEVDPDVPDVDTVVFTVLADWPDISISELTARTGFAQSHISESVARLRGLGVVGTRPDEADRRRTLVSLSERSREVMAERQYRDARAVLAGALAGLDPDPEGVAERLTEAADQLYRLLTARALGELAPRRERR